MGDFYHGVMGAIFAYLGFREEDAEIVRGSVGGLGLILLLVMTATIVLLFLWVGALSSSLTRLRSLAWW